MFGIWKGRPTIMSKGSLFSEKEKRVLVSAENTSDVKDRHLEVILMSGKVFVTDINGRRQFLKSGDKIDVLESVFKNNRKNFDEATDIWKDYLIIWVQELPTKKGIWKLLLLLAALFGVYKFLMWAFETANELIGMTSL